MDTESIVWPLGRARLRQAVLEEVEVELAFRGEGLKGQREVLGGYWSSPPPAAPPVSHAQAGPRPLEPKKKPGRDF